LAEWWPGYWDSVQSHKPRTKIGYETAWRLRIEPRFGSMPVRRIKARHVDEWIAEMTKSGVSASKVIEATGVLKRVLDQVVRDKAIPSNPCSERTSRLPKRPKTDRPVLTPTEVERLAMAMPREEDRVLVRLLAWTGARIGEALALEWGDVNFDRRTLSIRRSVEDTMGRLVVGPTKTYETRTITLPDAMVSQLEALRRAAPNSAQTLIFPNSRGTHRRYRNWRRDSWDKACARSGVTATPHNLRATAASLLIDAGASPKDVQLHLGHESFETTMNLYVRVRPHRNVDIAARLDALIAEAG
jgi:integrase